nr:MAG TPA: hypothetical protein [Caudovirales sp. ctMlE25]
MINYNLLLIYYHNLPVYFTTHHIVRYLQVMKDDKLW